LMRNALDLSEKAVSNAFGPMKNAQPDAGTLRRLYNLTWNVGGGMTNYTQQQIELARQRAMQMAMDRMNNSKDMAMQRASQLQQTASPYVDRILNLRIPLIGRFLGPKSSMGSGSGAISAGGVGTSAGLNMGLAQGMKPGGTSSTSTQTTSSKTEKQQAAPQQGATVTVEVKGMPTEVKKETSTSMESSSSSSSSKPIHNTNAQGLGELGSAGMGVTTTGDESSTSAAPQQPMAGGVPVGQHKHGKQQHRG